MHSFIRFVRKLLIFTFFIVTIMTTGILYYIEFQLPSVDALNTIQLQVPLKIFTHDGKLIAQYGERRRIPVPFDQIPKPLIDAILATEDQRYFQHPGVDISGLARASVKLILTGRKEQGGSTITMQVARDFYLSHRKTFGRKLREILLALKIEHALSKQKILELYLNKIFLGSRAYGVAAAAQIYYGKQLNELTLDQFAMIAGLPKAPSALNPLVNPEAAKKRRDHVLSRMLELHYIDEKAYQTAVNAPLAASYHDMKTQIKAPYAAELVRQQLEQMYGNSIYIDGFNVYTTIDSQLQNTASQSVVNGLLAYDQRHGFRGPEDNLGAPSLSHMMSWKKKLQDTTPTNGLEPAAVVELSDQNATVLRANGSLVTVPWQGLSWARKQINADYLGRIPRSAGEILKLGDVIRIVQTNGIWRLAQKPKAEAGMVTLNPQNGEILALVGGFDFQASKFNRMTNAIRQPGSTFKPFIYSAALEDGNTLATVINDAPVVIENPTDHTLWRPQNDDRRFYGPTRLREALIRSSNSVSIRLLESLGTTEAVSYAQRFGFTAAQLPPTLSLALGTARVTPLDMAAGYAVFANGGFKVAPYIIDTIRNTQEETIYQAKPLVACPSCESDPVTTPTAANAAPDNGHAPRTIRAENAFLITSALHDVIQYGTAAEARRLKRNDLAGKTGTSQNQVDAWFVGYNGDYVALSWVGFDQPQSLHEYGAKAALPIWMEFMEAALKGRPDHSQEPPPGIVSIRIDPKAGTRASANNSNAIFEYFMKPFLPEGSEKESKTITATNNQSIPDTGVY